jgi:hypothetical protein
MVNGKDHGLLDRLMDAVSVTASLVMLALIGIQSTRAVSSLGEARADRHFAAMKGDLAAVAEGQILHYLDSSEFAESPADLSFVGTDGVAIAMTSSEAGWAATASHVALGSEHGCAVYFGVGPVPDGPAVPEAPGQVACTE